MGWDGMGIWLVGRLIGGMDQVMFLVDEQVGFHTGTDNWMRCERMG